MRVLQVASSLYDWGGIERYVAYLTEGLIERAHQVTVACPPNSPLDTKIITEKRAIEAKGKFQPALLAAYLRLFKEQKFDVVHVHFSPDFVLPAMAARMRRQKGVVLTRHVVLPWSARKVRLYTKLFQHIIPVSDAVQRKLEQSGVPREMMTVAKAGVPPFPAAQNRDEARQQLNFKKEEFSVASFGRLVQDKGVDQLLQLGQIEGVRVDIFGDGPERAELEKSKGPNVHFHGFVPDVSQAMAAVDCVAIPSRWEEAFPYSALEAMASGKPIVATNMGGLPEMVQPDVNGFLFEVDDLETLAQAIQTLKSNRDLAGKLGETGREIQTAEYTIPKMAERIEAVYQKLT